MLVLYASLYGWSKSSVTLLERPGVGVVLEGADEHGSRRENEKQERVREERERRDPGERGPSPAGRCVRPECLLVPRPLRC